MIELTLSSPIRRGVRWFSPPPPSLSQRRTIFSYLRFTYSPTEHRAGGKNLPKAVPTIWHLRYSL